jgi:hypothetical protein
MDTKLRANVTRWLEQRGEKILAEREVAGEDGAKSG